MLELRNRNEEAWPEELRPIGDGDIEMEAFAPWWERHRPRLVHLHPLIAEQWIYRHFRGTRFRFLPLDDLVWRQEEWTTDAFLGAVHLEFGEPDEPWRDYEIFQRGGWNGTPLLTAQGWRNGSWDVPPVVLETPDGVRSYDDPLPDVRYLVIEGSKRFRYLRALNDQGEPTGPHEVFVLSSPDAAG